MHYKGYSAIQVIKWLLIISFVLGLMYVGKTLLVPLFYAAFLAMLLYPVTKFIEGKLPRIVAILITLVSFIALISAIFYLFGSGFINLFEDLREFLLLLPDLFNRYLDLLDNRILGDNIRMEEILEKNSINLIPSANLIKNTLTISTKVITSFFLVFVYTFLFLLYRNSFEKIYLHYFTSDNENEASHLLQSLQKVSQNYFFGLLIIILLLGTLNGFGLWLIGIDYPFLFGYFAALLAIIPYIGTFIGGLLPFLYALGYTDNFWTPILVLAWYTGVQTLEGNVLTPKIVGSQVSLNPLFAIIALIAGGMIWGISGMVLFIPCMAMLKIIFDSFDELRPLGVLLGSNLADSELSIPEEEKQTENEVNGLD